MKIEDFYFIIILIGIFALIIINVQNQNDNNLISQNLELKIKVLNLEKSLSVMQGEFNRRLKEAYAKNKNIKKE